jgi:diacylglycerol kinase family enzyme
LYVLAVGNGCQAGGGFRVCDRAKLDDGLLDVLIVPELPFDQALATIGNLMTGTQPPDAEHLPYHRVPWLDVEAPDGMRFNLDGEPIEGRSFRFEILPRHLPFVLPAHAPLTGVTGL